MSSHQPQLKQELEYRNTTSHLIDHVYDVLRLHNYGLGTQAAYTRWIRGYIVFHQGRHPKDMGRAEIERYLSHLSLTRKLSLPTQNQAMSGLVFLYRKVLLSPLADELSPTRCKNISALPVVLSRGEIKGLLGKMDGETQLMARIMYGGGLRLMEMLRLRVQDICFAPGLLTIAADKGHRVRSTLLARSVHEDLKQHLQGVRAVFDSDLRAGRANVWLPKALAKDYPNAHQEWGWQYVFPSMKTITDPQSGEQRRGHIHEATLSKALSVAKKKTDIDKRVTLRTLRHSFALHLLESGTNIRVVQKLMGHFELKQTEIYAQMLQQNLSAAVSPLDCL